MQTPGSPLAGGSSGGRKASKQIILVCHGQSDYEVKRLCCLSYEKLEALDQIFM